MWVDKEEPTAKTRAAALKRARIASESMSPSPSRKMCQHQSSDTKKTFRTSRVQGKPGLKHSHFNSIININRWPTQATRPVNSHISDQGPMPPQDFKPANRQKQCQVLYLPRVVRF